VPQLQSLIMNDVLWGYRTKPSCSVSIYYTGIWLERLRGNVIPHLG